MNEGSDPLSYSVRERDINNVLVVYVVLDTYIFYINHTRWRHDCFLFSYTHTPDNLIIPNKETTFVQNFINYLIKLLSPVTHTDWRRLTMSKYSPCMYLRCLHFHLLTTISFIIHVIDKLISNQILIME